MYKIETTYGLEVYKNEGGTISIKQERPELDKDTDEMFFEDIVIEVNPNQVEWLVDKLHAVKSELEAEAQAKS